MYHIRDKKTGQLLDLRRTTGYKTPGHAKLAFLNYMRDWGIRYKGYDLESYYFDDNLHRFEIVQQALKDNTEEELIRESIRIIEDFTKDYHICTAAEDYLTRAKNFLNA